VQLQLVEPADPQQRLGGSGTHHRDVDVAGGGAGARGAPRDVGRAADAARGRLARHMVRENEHPDAVAMVTLPVVGVLVRRRPEMTARVALISAGLGPCWEGPSHH
jgi:hypothetical protein